MTTDVTTTNLGINVLSRAQYDNIQNPSTDQLYFVEYDDTHTVVGSVSDTAPTNPQEGETYINTTSKKLYTYVSSTWDAGEDLSQDVLYIDGTNNDLYVWDGTNVRQVGGSGTAANVDGVTTSLNANDEIQAIGLIDKNSGNPKYDWVGTKQEYDALQTYNSNWIYYIVDDTASTGNTSLTNVYNRLNAAYAWINNGNVVYTVPCPVEGFKTYSDAENMTISSTIVSYVEDTSITDGTGTYTRDTTNDTVFGGIPNDSKNQFLTVYDLLKAIKG